MTSTTASNFTRLSSKHTSTNVAALLAYADHASRVSQGIPCEGLPVIHGTTLLGWATDEAGAVDCGRTGWDLAFDSAFTVVGENGPEAYALLGDGTARPAAQHAPDIDAGSLRAMILTNQKIALCENRYFPVIRLPADFPRDMIRYVAEAYETGLKRGEELGRAAKQAELRQALGL